MAAPRLKPLAEQVIVITGASSGIGLVTARRAAARGAKLVLVARNREALTAIANEINAAGGTAIVATADVGKLDEVQAAAQAAIDVFGRIDSWINDAGVAIYGRLVDTPDDEHRRLFETNYFGVVHGCRAALPHLSGRGGALITIGSIASDLPTPALGAYAASKHAIKAYVETLRMELQADGAPISVTLIKPSGVDTPIAQHAANHGPGKALVPPPVYAPELVADAILHAAEHPRREITVGGGGRAHVLIGEHFPWLIALAMPFFRRTVYDRNRPKRSENALFSPADDGRERSGDSSPRETSLYTGAALHPAAVAIAAGTIAAAALGVARWLRRRS